MTRQKALISMASLLPLSLAALQSCSRRVTQPAPAVVEHERAITSTRTEYVRDTVWLEVPAQSAEAVVLDSVSVLENDFATSTARINPDGTLAHKLATKPQQRPVERDMPVVYRDSAVYKDKEVKVPVPVERELTWWQSACVKWFPWTALLLLAAVCGIFRKPLFALIRRYI